MLPLPVFSLLEPKNINELKEYLAQASDTTKIIAGGTDIIPNLKHDLYAINNLISLKYLKELDILELNSKQLIIGANISLDKISKNFLIQEKFPALAYAASHIASPQIRRMGTVGGNICLDTRCAYFNQSAFWRKALGYCLKKDGDVCHVVKTGKRCVAASSNDLATMFLAYDADIIIFSPQEQKIIKLEDFYTPNGIKNNILSSQEIITQIIIKNKLVTHAGFAKLRHRESIDFPLLSIGVAFSLDTNNKFIDGRLVINALVAKPKIFKLKSYAGLAYSEALVKIIAKSAREKCHPQNNLADNSSWRKEMIEYYTRRAFSNALAIG